MSKHRCIKCTDARDMELAPTSFPALPNSPLDCLPTGFDPLYL